MAGLKHSLKALVRKSANAFGYDIVGYDAQNPRARLARQLARHDVTVVLDVGANQGQFGGELRELGFSGLIVSFEPESQAFAGLDRAARTDPLWQTARVGLGTEAGDKILHVAGNSQSSSFLPMLEAHRQAAPESAYCGQETVPVRRLDFLFANYCGPDDRAFLKIDTQGFERPVLEGARGILHQVPLLQLECSLVRLYDTGETIEEMVGYVRGLGYVPIDLRPTFHHAETGELMQADILFVRRGARD